MGRSVSEHSCSSYEINQCVSAMLGKTGIEWRGLENIRGQVCVMDSHLDYDAKGWGSMADNLGNPLLLLPSIPTSKCRTSLGID